MIHRGENPESVIEFTLHGCRHVQVTAGAQLASQGLSEKSSLDILGRWEKGSKMPERYDSASCVTELQTRTTIAEALRTGWRPSDDGSLPAPATPTLEHLMPGTPGAIRTVKSAPVVTCPPTPLGSNETEQREAPRTLVVVNTQRNMAHRVMLPDRVSICRWYTCGSPDQPAPNAKFAPVGNARRCTVCFGCSCRLVLRQATTNLTEEWRKEMLWKKWWNRWNVWHRSD